jgi:hypothetical protein
MDRHEFLNHKNIHASHWNSRKPFTGNLSNQFSESQAMSRLRKKLREKDRLLEDREITINYLERENEDLREIIANLKDRLKRSKAERKSSNIVWLEEESEDQIKLELSESYSSNISERRSKSESEEEENDTETRENILRDDDINPDEMTYEELLELGEQIGYVSRGFTEEQIKLIPIVKYKKSNSDIADEMCSVCQYDYLPGERLRKMSCLHSFHRRCVDDWLKREKVCPNCKEEVILNEK